MGWWVAYLGLVAALVVRVRPPEALPRPLPPARPTDPLRLVGFHHATFFLLLVVVSPGEALLAGGARDGRWSGIALFALGILLYRLGARALGDSLSPFVEPVPGGVLVTRGPYALVRHPMYLGQGLIAIGAPLALGCRWALLGSAVALTTLVVRIGLEDAALRRSYPEYPAYAARTKRILPYLF
jgi:protein-S-isoprenylcysteine O-methyltransferase Ste14